MFDLEGWMNKQKQHKKEQDKNKSTFVQMPNVCERNYFVKCFNHFSSFWLVFLTLDAHHWNHNVHSCSKFESIFKNCVVRHIQKRNPNESKVVNCKNKTRTWTPCMYFWSAFTLIFPISLSMSNVGGEMKKTYKKKCKHKRF